jgi:protein-S-isoprenylcysteine O-methyltransferase Ste14
MGLDWDNLDTVRALLTTSSAVPFLLFASAGVWHFGGTPRSGTKLVSITSLLAFVSVIYIIWTRESAAWQAVVGAFLQMLSIFLFGWCIGTSGQNNLSLAFGVNSSKSLLTSGPYSLVRHPFYTSYIIFWIGSAVAATSILTAVLAAAMFTIYLFESRREDKVLSTVFVEEFPRWRERTGSFFPKWL